jgi:hypothetical protein
VIPRKHAAHSICIHELGWTSSTGLRSLDQLSAGVTLGSGGDKGTGMGVTSGPFVRESQTNRYPRRKRKS